jgi:hypothetical protein
MTRHAYVNPAADLGDPNETGPIEWNEAHVTPVVTVSGTAHPVAAGDAGKLLRCTSSSATTVTVDNLEPGQTVDVLQAGTGIVSVAAGSGWTVVSRGSLFDSAGQWAVLTIYCDTTDHAVVTGDIA